MDGWMDIYMHIPSKNVHIFKLKVHTHLRTVAVSLDPSQQCLAEWSFSESVHLTGRARWLLLHRLAAAHTLRDCRVRPLLTTSPPRGDLVFLFLYFFLSFFLGGAAEAPFAVRLPP